MLDGLDQPRCPECGTAFDPNDPSTYRRKPDRWFYHRMMRRGLIGFGVLTILVGGAIDVARRHAAAGVKDPGHVVEPTIVKGGQLPGASGPAVDVDAMVIPGGDDDLRHADVVDLFAEEATGEPLPGVDCASPIADAAPPASAVADDSGETETSPAPARKKKSTAAKKKRKGAKSEAEQKAATVSSE